MRTISLVKRLKWNFSGNMNPHALVIGDVDNDNVKSDFARSRKSLFVGTDLGSPSSIGK